MTDFRLTPDPTLVRQEHPGQIVVALADLCRSPDGPRDRQAIFGDPLTILARVDGWCYVQLSKDGYCGFINETFIGAKTQPCFWARRIFGVGTAAGVLIALALFRLPPLPVAFPAPVIAINNWRCLATTYRCIQTSNAMICCSGRGMSRSCLNLIC